ncbi:MAG: phytanoyl-CoA dioxygenase family protein [Chloroflexi bacterium]|nr:phytanoyl-CoA dioxygenase family protein [Chloroflexota bacterium]MCL5275747.1 phytanoyl-CoA dioxygenase family protein [Chloroflexota bacterium]
MGWLISDVQWEQYERDGYLKLGKQLSDDELARLQQRIDDIMLGRAPVDYARMLMQLDSATGKYNDAGLQSKGFKGATLNYRKIQDLEYDPLFLAYTQRPLFREICRRVYGVDTPIASYRAMFMNKPARRGTWLPWHQDRWSDLDRDPLITLWTALDPATIANGCVQVIVGSHRLGVVNPQHPSAFLTEEQARELASAEKIVNLELGAGECVLLHNWLLHASDVNHTDIPRRAYSVCYMDANTRSMNNGQYALVFGKGALEPADVSASSL